MARPIMRLALACCVIAGATVCSVSACGQASNFPDAWEKVGDSNCKGSGGGGWADGFACNVEVRHSLALSGWRNYHWHQSTRRCIYV